MQKETWSDLVLSKFQPFFLCLPADFLFHFLHSPLFLRMEKKNYWTLEDRRCPSMLQVCYSKAKCNYLYFIISMGFLITFVLNSKKKTDLNHTCFMQTLWQNITFTILSKLTIFEMLLKLWCLKVLPPRENGNFSSLGHRGLWHCQELKHTISGYSLILYLGG